MTQRLLFTPHPVAHPVANSDDSQEKEKENGSKIFMGVLMAIFSGLGLIGFVNYLRNR